MEKKIHHHEGYTNAAIKIVQSSNHAGSAGDTAVSHLEKGAVESALSVLDVWIAVEIDRIAKGS